MPELLLRQAPVPLMAVLTSVSGRPANRLAWNNVDLDECNTYAVEF
jgi:hypothetical protein